MDGAERLVQVDLFRGSEHSSVSHVVTANGTETHLRCCRDVERCFWT